MADRLKADEPELIEPLLQAPRSLTRRYLTVEDFAPAECDPPERTGEFTADGYRQSRDLCGADTTDEVEGASAEAFIRNLRGEFRH